MPKSRPNIIFILTDDQGYGDLGCHGNTTINTPNLDDLHKRSIRFTNYHVGSTCAPTRAGLLTGHYCTSAGVWHTIGGRSLLRENEWTLADALRENGYCTGHFGKWHLGDSSPYRPHERGFDKTIYHGGGGIGNTGDAWGNDYFDDTYFENGTPSPFSGYCTDVFFREAMRFMEENKSEPFFCFIATNAPHGPLNIEPNYVAPYTDCTPHEDRARFYGMITNIDENVGKMNQHLNNIDIADETIIIFMTDNGTANGVELDQENFPMEGQGSYNCGMRGKKGSPYEGGHRVPFFLHCPQHKTPKGRDISELTSYVDFMPTILDLCDIKTPYGRNFHGESLLPLINDTSDQNWSNRTTVCDTQRVAQPIKWRQSSVMQNSWRLINGKELYNLQFDPGQREDISKKHPDRVISLRKFYEQWWELISPQIDHEIPIAIGNIKRQTITTHDLRNDTCDVAWNQGQVRAGHICGGYWEIDVKVDGTYKIELRRWPEETNYKLRDGIHGDDSNWRKDSIKVSDAPMYEGGKALDVEWAQIKISGQTMHAEVEKDQRNITFEVRLKSEQTHLFAAFYDRKESTIAPYYVYIELVGGE